MINFGKNTGNVFKLKNYIKFVEYPLKILK